jgi:hypothetical protein
MGEGEGSKFGVERDRHTRHLLPKLPAKLPKDAERMIHRLKWTNAQELMTASLAKVPCRRRRANIKAVADITRYE